MEDEEPDDAGDRGCDAVGPEEQRTVDRQAADLRVGKRGEQQGQRQPGERHHEREHEAGERAPEVGGVAEEPLEVGEAGPDEPVTEGRGAVEREPERVEGGPEEEGERDRDLRRHESVWQPPAMKRFVAGGRPAPRSEEHTSELQSQSNLVCRLLLEKKKKTIAHCSLWHISTVAS